MIYRFGEFELDDDRFTLSHQKTPRHVEPLVFDLIRFLVQHAGDVISRDALMDSVWKGRIVSDTTISGSIKAARKALGDSGNQQLFIRTIRGRGIKFVAPVSTDDAQSSSSIITPRQSSEASTLPSLVVLPFDVFEEKGDAPLSGLADGFVENLTTVLTRIPLLNIVSRSSSFGFRNESRSAVDVQREFGVNFMLEGSLQRVSNQVRINVQLINTDGGFHLWAQQFDCQAGDEVISTWLSRVVAVLEPQLIRGMMEWLRKDRDQLGGKQLLLQAMGLLSLRGWHKDTFVESTNLLNQALTREPDLALGRAYLALTLGLGHRVGLLEKSRKVAANAEREADRALQLDSYDSNVVSLAGCALADIGQPERAVPILENAITLNANNGHAWAALGSAETLLQNYQGGIEHLRRGIDISPADNRRAVWCAILAIACLQAGDLDSAIAAAKDGVRYDDRNYLPRVVLAGVELCRGDRPGVSSALRGALTAKPDLSRSEINGMVGTRLGATLWRMMAAGV